MTEKTCRLCLRRNGEFFEIFAPKRGDIKLKDGLTQILNFDIIDDTRLPSSICSNCYKIQAFIHEFRASCSRVNSYLNKLIIISPADAEEDCCVMVSQPPRAEGVMAIIEGAESKRMKPSELMSKDCTISDKRSEKVNPVANKEKWRKRSYDSKDESVMKNDLSWNQKHKNNVVENTPPIQSMEITKGTSSPCNAKFDKRKNSLRMEESKANDVSITSSTSEYQLKEEEVIVIEPMCDVIELKNEAHDKLIAVASDDHSSHDGQVKKNLNEVIHGTDINKAIYIKLHAEKNSGIALTPTIIKNIGLKVASTCGQCHFTASDGWLLSFIKRYDLSNRSGELKMHGYIEDGSLTNCYVTRYCCKELNEATYKQYLQLLMSGVELSANITKDIARRIAINEGLYEFTASSAWLKTFKKQFNIQFGDRKSNKTNIQLDGMKI